MSKLPRLYNLILSAPYYLNSVSMHDRIFDCPPGYRSRQQITEKFRTNSHLFDSFGLLQPLYSAIGEIGAWRMADQQIELSEFDGSYIILYMLARYFGRFKIARPCVMA
jgi:hypothetical protein